MNNIFAAAYEKYQEDQHENVILLNMSIMRGESIAHYYYKKSDKKEYRLNGISQLEPGTKYIISMLAEKKQKVDRIVIMCTPQAKESAEYYKERINAFIKNNENDDLTETDETVKQKIENFLNEKFRGTSNPVDYDDLKAKLPELLEAYQHQSEIDMREGEFKELLYRWYCKSTIAVRSPVKIKQTAYGNESVQYHLIETGSNSDIEFYKIINAIKGKNNRRIHLYIDTQGGSRGFMMEAMAIAQLLKSQNVELKGRYAIKYHNDNITNEIYEAGDHYKEYELITAMRTFKQYGQGHDLIDYFKRYYPDDKDMNDLVAKIDQTSNALKLCNTNAFSTAVAGLKRLQETRNKKTETKSGEPSAVDVVLDDILSEYSTIVEAEPNNFVIAYIKWCIQKSLYQQALTFIEAKMPIEFVANGIVYYAKDKDESDRVVGRLKPQDRNIDTFVPEHHYIKYFLKSYAKKNKESMEKCIVSFIRSGKPYESTGIHFYTNISERNLDSIEKLLRRYFSLAHYRNLFNHAAEQGTSTEKYITDEMDGFINLYETVLGVKPQIISGEIRKLFPVKMPVAICGQRQDCTLFQL